MTKISEVIAARREGIEMDPRGCPNFQKKEGMVLYIQFSCTEF